MIIPYAAFIKVQKLCHQTTVLGKKFAMDLRKKKQNLCEDISCFVQLESDTLKAISAIVTGFIDLWRIVNVPSSLRND